MTEAHRKDSTRLTCFDQSSSAWFFIITRCIKDKAPCLRRIVESQPVLSSIGKAARDNWRAISRHSQDVEVEDFVIMPNQLYGIVLLGRHGAAAGQCEPAVRALHATPLRKNNASIDANQRMPAISPKPGGPGVVIGSCKAAVTRWARRSGFEASAGSMDTTNT
jgi:hypothetical protein